MKNTKLSKSQKKKKPINRWDRFTNWLWYWAGELWKDKFMKPTNKKIKKYTEITYSEIKKGETKHSWVFRPELVFFTGKVNGWHLSGKKIVAEHNWLFGGKFEGHTGELVLRIYRRFYKNDRRNPFYSWVIGTTDDSGEKFKALNGFNLVNDQMTEFVKDLKLNEK